MRPILLMGGGGHCKSVIDSIEQAGRYEVAGIMDLPDKKGSSILGKKVIGTDDDLAYWYAQGITNAFITLGSIGNSEIREKLYRKAKEIGFSFPVIIDKSAVVSKHAVLEEGSFIAKGVIVNADVTIGGNAIINSGAIIEHDSQIGAFTHIAPGTTLSGGVIVGCHTHIGTNSSLIQGVQIGSQTLIGAGSVVLKNIEDNSVAYGNPCKKVK